MGALAKEPPFFSKYNLLNDRSLAYTKEGLKHSKNLLKLFAFPYLCI